MKVWEGEQIPPETIIGYQIQWQTVPPEEWRTVDEKTFYRAMFNEHTLCFGRFIRAKVDETILTNEDGAVRPLPSATKDQP